MKNDAIPTGKLARSGSAAATAARAGMRHMRYRTKALFADDASRDELQRQNEEDIAKMVFHTLSGLRGTALKLAQILSLEAEVLPDALRRELAKSYHQVRPINRALIRKVLGKAFGAPPEKLFSRFEPEPFAAASLGQVHRAEWQGQKLAVKVQYPGIAQTIHSDVGLVEHMIGLLPEEYFGEIIIGEIKERLLEEVDYRIEARNTRRFYTDLQVAGVVVPQVVDELSNATILTSSYLEGLHLDAWLETGPDQVQKNAFAQKIADVFTRMMSGMFILHADPNPGNFLFRPGGELGLLDFGCVRRFDPELSRNFADVIRAFRKDDVDLLIAAYRRMGLLQSGAEMSKTEFAEYIRPWALWWAEMFSSGGFDYGANPGFAFRGIQIRRKLTRFFDGFPPELVMLDRTVHGYLRIFERLQARVRMRVWPEDGE